MGKAIFNFLSTLAKALIPFVSYYAGYRSGKDDIRVKLLENQNAALKKEIGRINERPLTDDDVIKLLTVWEKDIS